MAEKFKDRYRIESARLPHWNYGGAGSFFSQSAPGTGKIISEGEIQIDTTLIYKTASDMPTYISWSAVGNGVNIQKRDTIIVASCAEKTYEIDI